MFSMTRSWLPFTYWNTVQFVFPKTVESTELLLEVGNNVLFYVDLFPVCRKWWDLDFNAFIKLWKAVAHPEQLS